MVEEKQPSKFQFIWQRSKGQIIITIASVLVGIIIYIYHLPKDSFVIQWNNWLNIYFSIVTLVVAIFIWRNEKVKEWEDALPKKLDITFLIDKKVFATVINSPLAGEADIRNWGQSIGQTILNHQVRIDFSGFKLGTPKIEKKSSKYRKYDLTIYLQKPIKGIGFGSKFKFGENGNLEEVDNKIEVPALALLNAPVLTSFGGYEFEPIKIETAKALLSKGFQSFIGHESTAAVLSKLLDVEIPYSRELYNQQPGEEALIFRLKDRISAGTVLQTIKDINDVGYELGLLRRTK